MTGISIEWRGSFTNTELHALHAASFGTRLYDETEWDWVAQVAQYSLGWVVARDGDRLVGFANVRWDGLVHAYVEDVMVDESVRGGGVGVLLLGAVRDGSSTVGCEFLHVTFDPELEPFYIDAVGFTPVRGGIMELQ